MFPSRLLVLRAGCLRSSKNNSNSLRGDTALSPTMLQSAPADELINLIYEAALDSSRWQDFLVPLAAKLNSHTGLIWANDFTTQTIDPGLSGHDIFTQIGFDQASLISLEAHYAKRNVWMEDPSLHVKGRVVNSEMLYPSSHLERTEFWSDWLRHLDIFYTGAAIVDKSDERSVNVTLCRPKGHGEYSPDEMGLLRRLMPHLQAGFALHRKLYRLQALSNAATGALEQIPYGVVLLDSHGRTLFFNQRAERLVEKSGLLRLQDDGPVRCVVSADDARLRLLVDGATRSGRADIRDKENAVPGGAMRISGLAGQQLQLLVAPLPHRATPFGMRTAAVIFLSDPASTEISIAPVLRVLYAMSPAETKLTEALVNGVTLQEYAATRGISLHTVRSHLKNSMMKMGVRRQTDLIRAVLSGPATLMRHVPNEYAVANDS